MKLKQIGFFRELRHGSADGDSLEASLSESKHKHHDEILEYLRSGKMFIASPGLVKDVLSDDRKIIGSANVLTDGVWAWPQDLVYYVENYNARLPEAFANHMASNAWTVPEVDVSKVEL